MKKDLKKSVDINLRKKRIDAIHKIMVYIFSSLAILGLFLILFFVIYNSIPFFKNYSFKEFITGKLWDPPNSYGAWIIILSTFFVLLISLMISVPLTLFTSLFICEYLSFKWKKRVISIIRLLAGIPSVIFGLFAITEISPIFISLGAPSGQNLLLASLILSFMSIPIMISLSINSIENVPDSYRYASLALGLTKSYTTFKIVRKSATLGILSAIIMGIARVVGETMAVIMIAGNSATGLELHSGLMQFLYSSIRTLAGTIGLEFLENSGPEHQAALYSIGVILFILVIIINGTILIAQGSKKWKYKIINLKKKSSKNMEINELRTSNLSTKQMRNEIWNKVQKHKRIEKFLNGLRLFFMISSTLITISFTLWISLMVIVKGIISFCVNDTASALTVGITPIATIGLILSTLILVITTILLTLPFSLLTSIYLTQYGKENSFFKKILLFSLNLMASTPSIVFGLFGLSIFIGFMHMPLSIITASMTLTFLILPIMVKSIENVLNNIPKSYKFGAYALGASKTETIWKVIVPGALRGIVTAVILAMARIVGESAPIYLTLGTVARIPNAGFLSIGTTLSVKIYMIFKEGTGENTLNIAYRLALIVMIIVFVLNYLSVKLSNFFDPTHIKKSLKIKLKETFNKDNFKNKQAEIKQTSSKIFNKIKSIWRKDKD